MPPMTPKRPVSLVLGIMIIGWVMWLPGCAVVGGSASPLIDLTREADQAYAAQNFVDAESLYFNAINQAPDQAYLWFRLGNTRLYNDQPAAAREAYQKAITLDPGFAKAYNNLATTHLLEAKSLLVILKRQLRESDKNGQLVVDLRLSYLQEALNLPLQDINSFSQTP
jgi:tetratricopeptide (TPR) repeat protein